MQDSFKTIETITTAEFKDRGSRFIGYAVPVISEEQVQDELNKIRQEHPKNRHVCYAFRIGTEETLERANDDGEPSGSAGKPILNQIYSAELTNVLVAVVRYFGGTLLGVPGLINAYKTAAAEAIVLNTIIVKHIRANYQLHTTYAHFHELMNYLKREHVDILEQELEAECLLIVAVELEQRQKFDEDISLLAGISAKFMDYGY